MNDDFEIKKDCHFIKNDLLNFIPQIELNFDENIQMTEELFKDLNEQLKEIIEEDDFSIIGINKGSLKVLITLEFLIKNFYIQKKEDVKSFFKKCLDGVKKIGNKLKKCLFFGKRKKDDKLNGIKPVDVSEYVKPIEDNEKEIIEILQEKCHGNQVDESFNFYEYSKSFSKDDLEELINNLKLTDLHALQLNQIKNDYEKYYDVFEKFFDKALALSVFEYQLVKIYTVDRDDYDTFKKNKNECENMREKILFHGTKTEFLVSILKTFVDIEKNRYSKMGKGFYLSDILDVSWIYYNNRCRNIPKIGDSFSVLVCDTYYSESKIEYCYQRIGNSKNLKVPEKGIRICKADTKSHILPEKEIEKYNRFIQNEYLISDNTQILPIYGINLRRIKFLIIWRDNNFDESNPNNYQNYEKMLKFNKEIKQFAYRVINSKIYYVSTTEDALKLIDRKKYNKIILITNGNNNGEDFINKAREIIGANTIALVSCFIPKRHLGWVKQMSNTLISNKIDFFKDFLKYTILEDKDEIIKLKQKIEEEYNTKFNNFNEEDLFKFPKFKEHGNYRDLEFDPKYNKSLSIF